MVKQGLRALANTSANFSNQAVQDAIATANIGFVTKTKTLQYLVDINSTLTDVQKTTIRASLNVQPYLNAGRYLQDLNNHTADMLQGLLGEADTDTTSSGTFLEQLGIVDGIQGSYLYLYGEEASVANRGVNDHFGSLRGILDDELLSIKQSVATITSAALATDTAFQNATQALINFVNALGDSSTLDVSTLNSLLSVYESAANNFNTILAGAAYSAQRANLIAARTAINSQLSLEATNLGSVRSYSVILTRYMAYQGLAENATIRDVIAKTAQTAAWKDYYENYETRFAQLSAKYENVNGDSENETIINNELVQRGLPDVKDHVDLRAVARKASRDTRLSTVKFNNRTMAEIIKDSCVQLGIDIRGLDVYGQSQTLLRNMNDHDRETIRIELNLHQESNTLS